MSLTDTPQPTRQALAIEGRSAPLKVTGKLKQAIDAMVWVGSCRDKAATAAGLTDHAVRTALGKPHVKAYYLGQLEVLRTSERARNFLAMRDVRDQDANQMAKLNAAMAMNRDGEQQVSGGAARAAPGFTILIRTEAHMPHVVAGVAKPLIEHEVVPVDEHERQPGRPRE